MSLMSFLYSTTSKYLFWGTLLLHFANVHQKAERLAEKGEEDGDSEEEAEEEEEEEEEEEGDDIDAVLAEEFEVGL